MFFSRPIPGGNEVRLLGQCKQYAANSPNIPLKKNWADTWCTLTQQHEEIIEKLLNYEVRADDVFVVTFMKSGTTWMQETAWLLMNDLDYERSKKEHLSHRSPYLGHSVISTTNPTNGVELSAVLPSPRLLKMHMPANLLPQQIWEGQQKIIYVARNCKDVMVSSFHFTKDLGYWNGDSIEEYADAFMNNKMVFTNYWNHIVDFWRMRHEPFIFFITYEEMKRDLAAVIKKLCTFLERPQLTAAAMEKFLRHLSFDSMKDNKQANLTGEAKNQVANVKDNFEFMRRGIVGAYKDELTTELRLKIDNWSRNTLAEHGLIEEDIFGKL